MKGQRDGRSLGQSVGELVWVAEGGEGGEALWTRNRVSGLEEREARK